MGPSGGGKTTLLKAILAAFLSKREVNLPSWAGKIDLADSVRIAYLPQDLGLAPWLTIRQNIILGRRLRESVGVRDLGALGERAVTALRLDDWLDSVPSRVSVGTARRAALARAIVTRPNLLLLDEPFSGLDFDVREEAVKLLMSEFDLDSSSIVMVTHEPYEAAALARSVHLLPAAASHPVKTLRRAPEETALAFQARIQGELAMSLREQGVA